MKTFLLTICFLSVQTGMVAIAQDKEQTPVYLDDTQPIEVRVQDALNRMTVEEKTRLSYAQGKFSSPGCPRLGIPELWMSDGPHAYVPKLTGMIGDMLDGRTIVAQPFLH